MHRMRGTRELGKAWLVAAALLAACGPSRRAVLTPLPPPPPRPSLEADEATPLRRVHPGVLRGLMIEGALRVEPDAELTRAIAARGDEPLLAVVAVCVDVDGNATAAITRPSPVPAFDDAALAVARTWRFRPFVDGGLATPACSLATFRHGAPTLAAGEQLPADRDDALPAARIELPPSVHVPLGVYVPEPTRARRGVALAWVCREAASRAAPRLVWLQSSGDPATDRSLFDRRATMPVGEQPAKGSRCAMWSAVAGTRDADDAGDPAQVPIVASEQLSRARVAGEKYIFPDDDVKAAIQRSSVHELAVPVLTCVDETGRPALVALLKSSGYPSYDRDLAGGVARWRYRPIVVDGHAASVCGVVIFAYAQS